MINNKKVNFKPIWAVIDSFDKNDTFLMRELISRMYATSPYKGLKIFYNSHMTKSSLLQIEALLASGAEVVLACKSELRRDPEVVKVLAEANLSLTEISAIKNTEFDIAIDCSAGFLDAHNVKLKYGVIELTQTGVVKYRSSKPNYPIISVDDSEIKKVETSFGTGDGLIRGFHKLAKAGLHNKKCVILGYGKVGHGIVKALSIFTKNIIIIECDLNQKELEKLEFPIYDIKIDKNKIVESLKDANCVITATGVKDLISKNFEKGVIGAKYLINMGSEDEWGWKFTPSEILNNKLAINFCLDYPTHLHLLDPIFYLQLISIDILLKNKYENQIIIIPPEIELPILTRWVLKHMVISAKGDFFEQILNNIPGFLYWKDQDSVYQGCNLNFAKAAGLDSTSDIVGKTDYELVWGEDEAETYRLGDKKAFAGVSLLNFEETQLQADGNKKTVLASKIPFKDIENNIIGVLGVYSDITDRKERERLEVETTKNKALLEIQEQFKKSVGQMIHDVRTPLSTLLMIAESMHELSEDKRIILRNATTAITEITGQLLRQYHPNNDEIEKKQITLVSTLIYDAIADAKSYANNKNISFKYEINSLNAFLFIKINRLKLRRSIANLLNNAIEACDNKNGLISIKLNATDNWVNIKILDNGCGMPKEVLQKIRNKEAVTYGKENGHGIGLSVVYDLVNSVNGEFEVFTSESKVGHGTTTSLRLPKISKPVWLMSEITISPNSILVILDDDKSIHGGWDIRLAEIVTKVPSIKVHHFVQGEEAYAFIMALSDDEKERVYLLSDYELVQQELNGLQIIKRLNLMNACLVTSYHTDSAIIHNALQSGVKVLPKDLVHLVSINMMQNIDDNINVHIVFVDDDKDFTTTLIATYYDKLITRSYANPFEFLAEVDKYTKNTRIIIDNYYFMDDHTPYAIDGRTIAEELNAKGFTNLCLLSGEYIDTPDYLELAIKTDKNAISQLFR